jgi:hypothetical protein
VSLKLDFGQARVIGMIPTGLGDWNGDGRKDLLYGADGESLVIHLGVAGAEGALLAGGEVPGPGFGPVIARQALPADGAGTPIDLDADGLDDLVVHDPRDESGVVRVLWNRGVLPGTRARMKAAEVPEGLEGKEPRGAPEPQDRAPGTSAGSTSP